MLKSEVCTMFCYSIRRMAAAELKYFYTMIERDFLPGEYAPYDVLFDQISAGVQEGLVFCRDSVECAYAVCSADGSGFVLISLMAVYSEFRGQGIGSEFVEAIKRICVQKQGIVVEVERPEDAETQSGKRERNRRIRFYEKLGFHIVPAISYTIWGVPMHLMLLPVLCDGEKADADIESIICGIYLELMGEELMHNLVIKKI